MDSAVIGQSTELVDLKVTGNTPYVLPLPPNDQAALELAIDEFSATGVNKINTHSPGSHYSSLCPRYKTGKSAWMISNLKLFKEQYIDPTHFKIETIKDVLLLIHPVCYFATVDFKHAYFSIPVKKSFRKYFSDSNGGISYFNSHASLKGFHQLLVFLRNCWSLPFPTSMRIHVVCYIDDCTFIAENKADFQRSSLCCSIIWQAWTSCSSHQVSTDPCPKN